MIVKNGGEDLRACLAIARPFVDQIVVADTGSTDDTAAIARSFGALVLPVPWTNHFAEARNAALDPITTDWVLSLDADEELSAETAPTLRPLLDGAESAIGGYLLPIRGYFSQAVSGVDGSIGRINTDRAGRAKEAKSWGVHRYCRLFRRHPGIFYSGRIHEGVELQILRAGYRYINAELLILHFGNLADPAAFQSKRAFYRDLLRLAVVETPNLPHLWVQLAIEEAKFFDNPGAALVCAQTAVRLSPGDEEAWSLIAQIHHNCGRFEDALHALRHLPDAGDRGISKLCSLADALHNLARLPEAQSLYEQALGRLNQRRASFPSELLASVESRLGYTEARQGNLKSGLRRLRRAVERAPRESDNRERLIKAYLFQQNTSAAAEAAESSLEYLPEEKFFRRAIALRVQLKQTQQAEALVDQAVVLFPASEPLEAMRAELHAR